MRPITKDAAFAADTVDRNKNISNTVLVALCFFITNIFIRKNIKYIPDNEAIIQLFCREIIPKIMFINILRCSIGAWLSYEISVTVCHWSHVPVKEEEHPGDVLLTGYCIFCSLFHSSAIFHYLFHGQPLRFFFFLETIVNLFHQFNLQFHRAGPQASDAAISPIQEILAVWLQSSQKLIAWNQILLQDVGENIPLVTVTNNCPTNRFSMKYIIFAYKSNLLAYGEGNQSYKSSIGRGWKDQPVVGGTAWCQPDDRVEMVYKHLPARLAYLIPNSRIT